MRGDFAGGGAAKEGIRIRNRVHVSFKPADNQDTLCFWIRRRTENLQIWVRLIVKRYFCVKKAI